MNKMDTDRLINYILDNTFYMEVNSNILPSKHTIFFDDIVENRFEKNGISIKEFKKVLKNHEFEIFTQGSGYNNHNLYAIEIDVYFDFDVFSYTMWVFEEQICDNVLYIYSREDLSNDGDFAMTQLGV